MSEINHLLFETRSEADSYVVQELARLSLGTELEPIITPTGNIGEMADFDWGKGMNHYGVARIVDVSSVHKVAGFKSEYVDIASRKGQSTTYDFVIPLNRFTVVRSLRDYSLIQEELSPKEELNLLQANERKFEGGEFRPLPDDWDKFLLLLSMAAVEKTKIPQTTNKRRPKPKL